MNKKYTFFFFNYYSVVYQWSLRRMAIWATQGRQACGWHWGLQLAMACATLSIAPWNCMCGFLRTWAPPPPLHRGNSLLWEEWHCNVSSKHENHTTDQFVGPQKSRCINCKLLAGKISLKFLLTSVGEEKEGTWGKIPVTIACPQKKATNLSISANLCGCSSRNQSLDHLCYLQRGNDAPSEEFLSDKQ